MLPLNFFSCLFICFEYINNIDHSKLGNMRKRYWLFYVVLIKYYSSPSCPRAFFIYVLELEWSFSEINIPFLAVAVAADTQYLKLPIAIMKAVLCSGPRQYKILLVIRSYAIHCISISSQLENQKQFNTWSGEVRSLIVGSLFAVRVAYLVCAVLL